MTERFRYNYSYQPSAKLDTLSFGQATDWYIHDNVDDCYASVPAQRIGNKWWPRGWFATIECINHDEMRDFNVEQRDSWVVGGPFASEEEAIRFAEDNFDDFI